MTMPTNKCSSASTVERCLSIATNIAASIAFCTIFYMLLRESGPRSPLKFAMRGDYDAAFFKIAAVSTFFLASTVLLGYVSKRLAFFCIASVCAVLVYVTAFYEIFSVIVLVAVTAGIVMYMFKKKFHTAPINKWLSVIICLVVFSLVAFVVSIRIFK